jgi:O-antigen/teichoic acid export membrane protein
MNIFNIQFNKFVKNVLNVSFFTILAQIIGLLALPIITRIYSPYDFGLYSFFVTVISIVGIFATSKFDQAILVSDKDQIKKSLLFIIFLISSFISFFTIVVLVFLDYTNLYTLDVSSKFEFFFLIFLSIIFYANSLSLNFWHNSNGRFTLMGSASLMRSASAAIVKIFIGSYLLYLGFGLIYGFVFSQGIFLCILIIAYYMKDYDQHSSFKFKLRSRYSLETLKETIIRYKDFPKFALPTDFILTLSLQAPILLTGPIFGGTILGYFALSRTVLGLPAQVLGGSVKTVFQKEAAAQYNKYASCESIFKKTLFSMTAIVFLPCILTILFAEPVFVLIFGEEWKIAGEFCQILAPLYFIRMIAKPLTFMFQISNHLKFDMKLMNMFLVFSIIAFSVGTYLDSPTITFILISSLHSLGYLIYLWFSYKFSTGYKLK